MPLWYDCGPDESGRPNWQRQRGFARADLGADLYLVCPGPSLSGVDPASLRVPGAFVLGINTTYPRIRPDMWLGTDEPALCYDGRLWGEPFPKIVRGCYRDASIGGRPLRLCPALYFMDAVKGVPTLAEIFARRGPDVEFVWNRSTFRAALHLAVWMGARRIRLVGCDCGGAGDYHDGRQLTTAQREHNRGLYASQVKELAALRPEAEKRGIEIACCTPGSPLNGILRSLPLAEALAASQARVASLVSNQVLHVWDAHRCCWGELPADTATRSPVPGSRSPIPAPRSPIGVLTGADRQQEDLLPWWYEHFRRHNPDLPVAWCDFGLPEARRKWCEERGPVIRVEPFALSCQRVSAPGLAIFVAVDGGTNDLVRGADPAPAIYRVLRQIHALHGARSLTVLTPEDRPYNGDRADAQVFHMARQGHSGAAAGERLLAYARESLRHPWEWALFEEYDSAVLTADLAPWMQESALWCNLRPYSDPRFTSPSRVQAPMLVARAVWERIVAALEALGPGEQGGFGDHMLSAACERAGVTPQSWGQVGLSRGMLARGDLVAAARDGVRAVHGIKTVDAARCAVMIANATLDLNQSAWFRKPFAFLQTPFAQSLWVDADCEVRASVDGAFDYARDGVGLTRDPWSHYCRQPGAWATGVVAFRHGEPAIQEWCKEILARPHRGDQDALDAIRERLESRLVEMPMAYQHISVAGPAGPGDVIQHWVGPAGKAHIRGSGTGARGSRWGDRGPGTWNTTDNQPEPRTPLPEPRRERIRGPASCSL